MRPSKNCILSNLKVDWEHNYYNRQFTQDGDFFVPGGHYFAWSPNYFRSRCTIFGPVETVYTVDWVHHSHGGREEALDAGLAYAGWARLAFYEGRLNNLTYLGQSDYGEPTDLLTGAKNHTYTRA